MPVVDPRLVVHMLLAAFCPPATGSEEELEGAMAMAMSQIICTRPASILRSTAAPNRETNSTKKIETESIAKAGGPHEEACILPAVVQVCSSPRFAASGKNWTRGRGRGGKAEIERAWENVAAACVVGVSLVFVGNVGTADAVDMAAGRVVTFPWEQAKAPTQEEPQRGTCATCIGVVDDTLGACSATTNCVSSFDDRPKFFVAPWEFPGKLETAVSTLKGELLRSGATIKDQGERYIYAVYKGEDGIYDDVEFLFSEPALDATVNVRAASRAVDFKDSGRNRKRLEALRMSLDWEQVPILRNRQRRLFFIESPWDTFGPEPPPTFNYNEGLEFVPE